MQNLSLFIFIVQYRAIYFPRSFFHLLLGSGLQRTQQSEFNNVSTACAVIF